MNDRRTYPPQLPTNTPFRTEDALAAGVSRYTLERLRREGLLRAPLRGVFVHADAPDSIALRADALSRVVAPGCVVTDRWAAWLHEVDIMHRTPHPDALPPVQCFSASDSRVRRQGVVSGTRTLRPEDVVTVHGVQVTAPLRTAMDLGRLAPMQDALAALDAFARRGVSRREMEYDAVRYHGMRGVIQLRALIALADPLAESPAESALRLHWIEAVLPRPVLQHPVVVDGRCFRLDIADPVTKFAAEYDGEEFHGVDRAVHDRIRRQMLASVGWSIVVFTKDEVYARGAAYARLQSEFQKVVRRRRG